MGSATLGSVPQDAPLERKKAGFRFGAVRTGIGEDSERARHDIPGLDGGTARRERRGLEPGSRQVARLSRRRIVQFWQIRERRGSWDSWLVVLGRFFHEKRLSRWAESGYVLNQQLGWAVRTRRRAARGSPHKIATIPDRGYLARPECGAVELARRGLRERRG